MDIGWELGEIRTQMAELNKRNKFLTTAFKKALHDEKLTEAGGYRISIATGLKVANFDSAWKWADQYPAVRKIDTTLAREIFRKGHGDPIKHGFEYTETERVESLKDVDQEI